MLKNAIQEQRHGNHAYNRDESPCEIQPATNEQLGECCCHYAEQIKGARNPGLETRRRFSNPFHHSQPPEVDATGT
jgi:hypothetical protein